MNWRVFLVEVYKLILVNHQLELSPVEQLDLGSCHSDSIILLSPASIFNIAYRSISFEFDTFVVCLILLQNE